MTEPTREQMLNEGRKQARIYGVVPLFVEVYAKGWAAAMARADRAIEEAQRAADKSLWEANFNADLAHKGRIEELERQLRCVQLYGYGYLLNHGGRQIALDPKDVTVVIPSTRHMDDFDLNNSLYLAEQQVKVLQERIRKVRERAQSAEARQMRGCAGYGCDHDECPWLDVWTFDPSAVLAALDGDGEETVEPMLGTLAKADIDAAYAVVDAPYQEGVHLESDGAITELSKYQDWRHKQDREQFHAWLTRANPSLGQGISPQALAAEWRREGEKADG